MCTWPRQHADSEPTKQSFQGNARSSSWCFQAAIRTTQTLRRSQARKASRGTKRAPLLAMCMLRRRGLSLAHALQMRRSLLRPLARVAM
eukprot:scaffold187018_cov31-Tisochrysis_lutea.AAC.4